METFARQEEFHLGTLVGHVVPKQEAIDIAGEGLQVSVRGPGIMETMPNYALPPHMQSDVSMAVEIFGNKARVAILGYLAGLGPGEKQTRGKIVEATLLEPVLVGRHLVALEESGVVTVDQPTGDRRGTRPKYWLNRDRTEEIYAVLGAHLGIVVPRASLDVEAINEHLDKLRALFHRA